MTPTFQMEVTTPSTTWVVNHNLNKVVASDVMIYDSFGNLVKMLPLNVEITSDNTVTITFSQPQTGFVTVI